jgi:hypothetical protein
MSRAVLDVAQILGLLCGTPGAIFLRVGLFNRPGRAVLGGIVLTLAWSIAGYILPVDSWILIPAAFVATGVTAHALNAVTFGLAMAVIAFWHGKDETAALPHTLAVVVLFMAALVGSGVAIGLIRQVIPQLLLFTVFVYGLLLGLFADLLLMTIGIAMTQQSTEITSRHARLAGVSLSALAAASLLIPPALSLYGMRMV